MSNNTNNSNFRENGERYLPVLGATVETNSGTLTTPNVANVTAQPLENGGNSTRTGGIPASRAPGSGTSRNYCVTIHIDPENGKNWNINGRDYSVTKIVFIVGQMEICPTTNKVHYQVYLQCKQPVRFTQVKTMLGCDWAHIEESRGSCQQNIDYCTKTETRAPGAEPFRWGTASLGQGSRTDLAAVSDAIKAGKSIYEIANDHSDHFLRHAKSIMLMSNLLNSRAASTTIRRDLEVILILGHPGTGKTRYVFEKHGLTDVYKLNTGAGTTWWDGYSGQPVLLIDDFYGTGLQWKEFLNILDIYPLQVQVKGSTTWVNYRTVYITSNTEWFRWYPSIQSSPQWKIQIGALYRRLSKIYRVPSAGHWVMETVRKTPTGEPILPDYCEPSQWADNFIPPPGPVFNPVDGILEPAMVRHEVLGQDDDEENNEVVAVEYQQQHHFDQDEFNRDNSRTN